MKSLEGWIWKRINSVLLPQKTRAFSSPSNKILMMSALSLQIDVMVVHHLPSMPRLIMARTTTDTSQYKNKAEALPAFPFSGSFKSQTKTKWFCPVQSLSVSEASTLNRKIYMHVVLHRYGRLDPLKWNSNMQWGTQGTRMNHWFNDAWPIPIEDT